MLSLLINFEKNDDITKYGNFNRNLKTKKEAL